MALILHFFSLIGLRVTNLWTFIFVEWKYFGCAQWGGLQPTAEVRRHQQFGDGQVDCVQKRRRQSRRVLHTTAHRLSSWVSFVILLRHTLHNNENNHSYEECVEVLLKHGARPEMEARMCWPGPHHLNCEQGGKHCRFLLYWFILEIL